MKSLSKCVFSICNRSSWLCAALVLATLVATPCSVDAADWSREIAAPGHWFQTLQPDSMILDSAGELHMVYGWGRLYYRLESSTGVTTEIVDDTPGTGGSAVIAIDDSGNPMIAYRDLGNNQLKFAWKESGTWQYTQLDAGDEIGTYMSMKVDSTGQPHIVYNDMFHNDLIYTYRNTSGVWRKEIIDDTLPGDYCTVALYDDNPRVAYYNSDDRNLMIASRTGYDTWEKYMLNTSGSDGRYCSLTVGTADNIMAVFYNATDKIINMVRCDGGTFSAVYEIDSAEPNAPLDVTHSYDGQLKVAYIDSTTKACRVAHGIYTNWTVETIHSSGSALHSPAIAMLPSGLTVVRYVNSDTRWMYLGRNHGGSGWTTEPIVRSFSTGFVPRMVTNSQGHPYSIFNDYPTFYTFSVIHDGFGWKKDPYPLIENIPTNYDLMMLSDDRIVAVSGSNSQLIRGHYFDGNTWHDEDVFAGTGIPVNINITRDTSDNIYIVYSDLGSGNVALLESSSWNGPFTMTELGACSGDCDVAIDSNNHPHVIYEQASDNALIHTWRTAGSTWNTETLAPNAGDYVEVVLDSQDRLYATIFGIFMSEPWFVRPDGQTYLVEPIPSSSSIMPGIKMAVKDDDTISLALVITSQNHLRYMEFDGANWHTETPLGTESVSMLCLVHSSTTGVTIGCHSDLSGDYLMITKKTGINYGLNLNDDMFAPGEPFVLNHRIANYTDSQLSVDEYLILDVAGFFWFWPSWSETVDLKTLSMNSGDILDEEVFNFTWPSGVGSFSPIYFWGGLCHAGTADVIQYDFAQWGYGE